MLSCAGQLCDALAKYQVMLDNELYKAIKALRETQVWRLDALNGFVLEKKQWFWKVPGK